MSRRAGPRASAERPFSADYNIDATFLGAPIRVRRVGDTYETLDRSIRIENRSPDKPPACWVAHEAHGARRTVATGDTLREVRQKLAPRVTQDEARRLSRAAAVPVSPALAARLDVCRKIAAADAKAQGLGPDPFPVAAFLRAAVEHARRNGATHAEVAAACGLDPGALHRALRPTRETQPAVVRRILAACGCSMRLIYAPANEDTSAAP